MRPKRVQLFLLAMLGVVALALVVSAFARPMVDGSAQKAYTPPTLFPSQKVTTVAFIGDSYTAGTGVSPGDAWPSLLSGVRGWKAVNLARGGTGYLAAYASGGMKACGKDVCPNYLGMVPDAVAAAPDIVIVSGGRNDGGKLSSDLARNIASVFAELRKGLPNSRIIAIAPVLAADDTADSFVAMKPAVKAAVEAVGGVYVDLGAPLGGHPELIGPDAVHPNVGGHKALADAANRMLPKFP